MPKYKIKGTTLIHGVGKEAKQYEEGSVITLSEEEAAPIMHHLESAEEAKSSFDKQTKDDLMKMKKDDLHGMLDKVGVPYEDSMTKDELADLLIAAMK